LAAARRQQQHLKLLLLLLLLCACTCVCQHNGRTVSATDLGGELFAVVAVVSWTLPHCGAPFALTAMQRFVGRFAL
jgi:hypothetical protein